jgi:hypothetical protein
MEIPNQLPILSHGKQQPNTGKVCAEQAVNWLASGRLDLGDETDHPDCVQPVLNSLAIYVNDRMSEQNRHKMWPILLRQIGTAKPELEPQLSVDLAQYAAKSAVKSAEYAAKSAQYAAEYAAKSAEYAAKSAQYAAEYAAKSAQYAAEYAQYAAEYAAKSAQYAAESAQSAQYAAVKYAEYADISNQEYQDYVLLKILTDFQDEHERLTGHVPASCDVSRLERLGELVGIVQ